MSPYLRQAAATTFPSINDLNDRFLCRNLCLPCRIGNMQPPISVPNLASSYTKVQRRLALVRGWFPRTPVSESQVWWVHSASILNDRSNKGFVVHGMRVPRGRHQCFSILTSTTIWPRIDGCIERVDSVAGAGSSRTRSPFPTTISSLNAPGRQSLTVPCTTVKTTPFSQLSQSDPKSGLPWQVHVQSSAERR